MRVCFPRRYQPNESTLEHESIAMAKSPPLTDGATMLVLALLFVLAALVACAAFGLAWSLFQFIVWVLSPLWETVGHWLG